jgi:hypothetical protein
LVTGTFFPRRNDLRLQPVCLSDRVKDQLLKKMETLMNSQTHLQNIFEKLTPEYFAERVLPGAFNVLVILVLM